MTNCALEQASEVEAEKEFQDIVSFIRKVPIRNGYSLEPKARQRE